VKTNPLTLDTETTTLATGWLLQRLDGTLYRFTDHDTAVVIAGQGAPIDGTYLSAIGYSTAKIESRADLSVDELTVGAVLDDTAIRDDELRAGLFDYASVWLFLVDWASPGDGILKLRRGTLGEVGVAEGRYHAELRGLAQFLQQTIGESHSAACRADLGDARCGVSLGGITDTGTLTGVTGQAQITDSARAEADGHYDNGVLTMTDGPNAGAAREVKAFSGGAFTLHQPLPWLPETGDAYQVHAGCQKTLDDCRDKFDNVINFRGEPHVPGQDEILAYPNAR